MTEFDEKQLREELAFLLLQKKEKEKELENLEREIARREAESQYLESALAESYQLAQEIEEQAHMKARQHLLEAEVQVASCNARLSAIEEEIARLEEEWELCQHLVFEELKAREREKDAAAGFGREAAESKRVEKGREEADTSASRQPLLHLATQHKASTVEDARYAIKLVSFVNARHYVAFGSTRGPLHAHSWQFQIEVKVPLSDKTGETEVVEFAKIVQTVKEVLAPYENTILNHIYPFNIIQPSTENITFYFFNRLEDALAKMGLALGKLAVWETPMRGVEVTQRNAEMEALLHRKEEEGLGAEGELPAVSVEVAWGEAAASAEAISPLYPRIEEGKSTEGKPAAVEPVEKIEAGKRSYPARSYLASAAILILFSLLAYWRILFPPLEQHYPWGSDTWGHLFKAEYLYEEILKGNYYPQFTEYWYNGSQPFRYWAPLPYYVLALLRFITGDIFVAGNYYVFICALVGAMGWLLLAPRLGLWPAVMAGAVWCIWQDNVRIAFSEGNLPRVLAIAFLPILFAVYLRVLEEKRAYFSMAAVVVFTHLTILCHAMIGAAYGISLALFTLFFWIFRGCHIQDGGRGLAVLALGVASAGWWLLPALSGGITQIDPEAVKEAIQFVPAKISFDPTARFANREVFYWGISLGLALLGVFLAWRSRPPWARSLAVCGLGLILITFPVFRLLYLVFPLSHLIWPLRFSSFAALAVVAAAFSFNPLAQRHSIWRTPFAAGIMIGAVFSFFLVDCGASWQLLAYTGTNAFSIMESSRELKDRVGWRVATLDLSRLGSAPSFLFSELAGLEQVFGWAWQGAVTSNNIMLLNTGLEFQYYPFLFRSCQYLGATDLVVKDDVLENPALFRRTAEQAGYRYQRSLAGISFWHSVDYPYLVEIKRHCLVIGKYAGTVALQFPEVEMGSSHYIDDYSLEHLQQYPMIILSGAEWKVKKRAEELISEYAASGGRAFVELAGMPANVLAKQPEFLGVYGEPVVLHSQIEIKGREGMFLLQPFSLQASPWKSYVPMGLDAVELEVNYYGNQAAIYGYKLINNQPVYFLGGNLLYHTFLTCDPVAVGLLQRILGLSLEYTPLSLVPLSEYRANEDGYVMTYEGNRAFEAIVPVAAMDGLQVEIDGSPWPAGRFENLVLLDLPAGRHQIRIYLKTSSVYQRGTVVSLLAIALLIGFFVVMRRGDIRGAIRP